MSFLNWIQLQLFLSTTREFSLSISFLYFSNNLPQIVIRHYGSSILVQTIWEITFESIYRQRNLLLQLNRRNHIFIFNRTYIIFFLYIIIFVSQLLIFFSRSKSSRSSRFISINFSLYEDYLPKSTSYECKVVLGIFATCAFSNSSDLLSLL